ncbi:MAG: hypothetical protein IH920_00635 [Chloroflexi bacterium]|nr:hypothetical protein [Chloroflexota bacterium]
MSNKAANPIAGRPRLGRFAAVLAALAVLATAAAACGGSSAPSAPEFPDVITLGEGEVFPVITNSTLAVGENRFSLGLLDEENSPVLDADIHLRFFDLTGDEPVLTSEADARFVPVELSFIDEPSGKEKRLLGSNGVYVTQVSFDTVGAWGVQLDVTLADGRQLEPIPFRFDVLEETAEPAIGDPAPASRQLTLADVDDVTEIDSSFPSRPHMHEITVADALAAGKPILVAFATPAFCESRTCGPLMDTVMDPLYERYADDAVFIHIEPFQLKQLREGIDRIPVEATAEWGLQTEPWLFVIDAQGRIVAKFEGIIALDEVETVLVRVLEA